MIEKHRMFISFTPEVWEKLRKLSYDTHKSINQIVNDAVNEYLESKGSQV